MGKDVIVALDFATGKEALDLVASLGEEVYVKIGMELFYSEGPEIVREFKKRGHKVFLDLKLHDIPNTVYGGIRSLSKLGVDMTNIHMAGGGKMVSEAVRAIEETQSESILLGVTILTSTSEERMKEELLIQKDYSLEEVVLKYATLGKENGLHGVVCSAMEGKKLRKELGEDFVLVCPGIRPKDAEVGDQVRVVTPEEAKEWGVDYIVVGRPITKAENPKEAYEMICKAFIGEEK